MKTPERKLPALKTLVSDIEKAVKSDQLKQILNVEPPQQWIKTNPYANNTKYLPIDKVEMLMDSIFQDWKVEVLKTAQLFNAIEVTVRVHYVNPLNGNWYFHDGVGAKELQTKKDSGHLKVDFSNINKSAVEMALPIAKSTAIKDACDHLGKIFGRDLGRKDTINHISKYDEVVKEIPMDTLMKGARDENN